MWRRLQAECARGLAMDPEQRSSLPSPPAPKPSLAPKTATVFVASNFRQLRCFQNFRRLRCFQNFSRLCSFIVQVEQDIFVLMDESSSRSSCKQITTIDNYIFKIKRKSIIELSYLDTCTHMNLINAVVKIRL